MEHDGFAYNFTPKELRYFLFGKKVCPRCGGHMEKSKEYETISGAEYNAIHKPTTHGWYPTSAQKVKYYRYYYICEDCKARYSLSELAEPETSRP